MRERFRLAYGPAMDVEDRSEWGWSDADAARVARALAVAFLIRLVILPLFKWVIVQIVIPALVLLLLRAI